MNRLQLSIGKWLGEWLRDHEEPTLVFRSWSRYFSFMYFHVFLINYQTSSYGFFGFCLFFPNEITFSSILTNELKQFVSGAIPSLVKKKNSATFQLFWTDAYTDHIWRVWYNGSYTIMAEPIKTLELHYQMIQFFPKCK